MGEVMRRARRNKFKANRKFGRYGLQPSADDVAEMEAMNSGAGPIKDASKETKPKQKAGKERQNVTLTPSPREPY